VSEGGRRLVKEREGRSSEEGGGAVKEGGEGKRITIV
jgi:hypothetical protein